MLARWALPLLSAISRAAIRPLAPLALFLACIFLPGSCTCAGEPLPPPPRGVIACEPQHPSLPTASFAASEIETAAAGTIPVTFSTTSAGEASLVIPFRAVPGGAVQPSISLTYSSAGGDGALGAGFSLTGSSAITRCPSHLGDGDARDVRYDKFDKLCLDGRPLTVIRNDPGVIEYRTKPDTHARILGHDPDGDGTPQSFDVLAPSGLMIAYGTTAATRPRGPGGAPRAWLAAVARNARGEAMDFGYCFADAGDYTAEYALDEIRYTRFEGSPAREASRAVKLVYGTKDPAALRTHYSRGMAHQNSLRLDEIQMIGPGNELVRRYPFTYALSATNRTLLTQVEECSGDVCKPPTRFHYRTSEPGFHERVTNIPAPTSEKASPLIIDIDADGLDDLVVPDTDEMLSTPANPITRWLLARNGGASASPPYLGEAALAYSQEWSFVDNPDVPADPARIQPEVGTPLDYDQNGLMDVLLHDVHGSAATWQVLLAQPNRTFKRLDTGIPRPFPLGVRPLPPALIGSGGSTHLADVDGDRVPDLIQCHDHRDSLDSDPGKPVWRVHLWKPERDGVAAGFDPEGEPIEKLAEHPCAMAFYAADLDNDAKMELVMTSLWIFSDGTEQLASTYYAHTRRADGTWEVFNTKLPVLTGGRVLFMDVNGDSLPDAVLSGHQDHALRTYINTGPTFAEMPVMSLGDPGLGDQDLYFKLAAPLDWNGDGRVDLLMPVPPGTLTNDSNLLPDWAILQAKAGDQSAATFTLVDANIPFEAKLAEAITLADPHGPRIADFNGDGASDVLLPLGGVFHIFENLAPDQDVLIAVSDGMNEHDPADPEYVPNVRISYGHLIDTSITSGAAPGDPALESALYLSRVDPANPCDYPRRCVVGPRRVVSGYEVNDGSGGVRRFSVAYEDGRYDRRGPGFISFARRTITDLDTLAGSSDFYDNVTFDEALKVYPFAGQVTRQWRWNPGLPEQPAPDQIEMSFSDITPTRVPTNDGKTYFTIPTQSRLRSLQGVYSPGGPTLDAYVRKVESGGGAKVLRDTTAKVTDVNDFGNIESEEIATAGLDLTLHIERTFKNDTDRWVLGQLQTQTECSSAAKLSQCRTLTRTTTRYGEVDTESMETDDHSPETKRKVTYTRGSSGNITGITAEDGFGHVRSSTITYEPEGIFPDSHSNAAGHTSFLKFDARFGALTKRTDPNGLVTEWLFDGFGRLALEKRPDGTETSVTLSRAKDGGGSFRVTTRTTTSGRDDDAVEIDSLGRPIRWFWHGPSPQGASGEPPRLMQEVAYDARSGKVARRSVPVREGTADDQMLFDTYLFDAVGREVRHTTPWKALVQTAYDGLLVRVTDPLGNVTTTERDPLGRPMAITDAAKGRTSYIYGPFGFLYSVTDPGTLAEPSGAVTVMRRDALGRVKQLDDPGRGTTIQVWNGWGELVSSTDVLGRTSTFEHDALGRTKTRIDEQKGAPAQTTTWTWDTAANGIGKLHKLTSPNGENTYAYTKLGQPEGLTLAVSGATTTLEGKLRYDQFGRVETITYPTPAGTPAFVITQDYDPFGHILRVHDDVTDYWRLVDVDDAGRFREEVFGNNVSTERSYFTDKQLLQSIVTAGGAVQSLAYDYDARLSLKSRTDALQPQEKTERFRYDALDRLTCAYFSASEDPSAPCATSYSYEPNGNLTFKSDVGDLAYDDPAHPHAVTSAGSDSFGYDAIGNQVSRPGGVLVTYTPFDLPKTIKQGATAVTFGYDGDHTRIRKTTPDKETLYFSDLYERVTTKKGAAKTEHRYYVHSPERVIAVVTRGGDEPGTRYVHADNLGSVEKLTNEKGVVVEKRSYDAYGQRRNPVWGQPQPASFASKTTLGFTGHEADDEVGLVNMRGRVFDPRVGRFLTTDPIVSNLFSGQSFNPYSYVTGNPLTYVDPSGFQPATGVISQPGFPDIALPYDEITAGPGFQVAQYLKHEGPPPSEPDDSAADAADFGAAAPPTDVDTTGSSLEIDPQATTAPEDWTQNPYVQLEGGFLAGLALGFVPFGGVGQQLLDAGEVLPHGTPEARFGFAVGQIVGGVATMAGGVGGDVLGGAATVTGLGAAVGVPAMVVSTGLVVGGAGNVAAGIQGLTQSMMSKGPGRVDSQGTPTTTTGGGKNAQHANMDKKAAAQTRYEGLKAEYQKLRSAPNKTPELKAVMEKTERAMKKAKQEVDFSGENHSQRAKGQQ